MNRKNLYYQYSDKFSRTRKENRETKKNFEIRKLNDSLTRDTTIRNEIKNLNKQLKTLKINFNTLKNKKYQR